MLCLAYMTPNIDIVTPLAERVSETQYRDLQ